jgi:hypothetical protein
VGCRAVLCSLLGDDVTSCDIIQAEARCTARRIYGAGRGHVVEQKYDEQFAVVFDAIKRLIAEDDAQRSRPKRGIGFIS